MATKKQHYIPRMLLKHFTTFLSPMHKPLIYQYDKNKHIGQLVDISNICYSKYLYEIRDESGHISNKEINLIENGFSRLESMWDKIICKIEEGQCITQDDRCMLGVLLVLQVIRMPEVMEFISNWLYDTSANVRESLTRNKADRYMKLASFVWGQITPERNWILHILLKHFLDNKDIIIYHSNSEFILNGNRPVLCLKLFETDDSRYYHWYLPVTQEYCITLVEGGKLFDMDVDETWTNFLNLQNFQNNSRFIYGDKSILERLNNYEDNKNNKNSTRINRKLQR